jgi:predicted Zn-dependent peptidase
MTSTAANTRKRGSKAATKRGTTAADKTGSAPGNNRVTTASGAVVPAVGRSRPPRLPSVAERRLPNGLRVIVARRPGIPRFEARLRVSTVRGGQAANAARQTVLAETLLAGTPALTSVDIAEAAQRLGGSLSTASDAEWVVVAGSALSTELRPFLSLMGDVVRDACYPADEVAIERDRLAQEIRLARSQPEQIARDALVDRLFGRHPYGRGMPDPDAVARVSASALREVHATRLLAPGSVLVIVGDVVAERALAAAETAFGGWGPRQRGKTVAGGRLSPPKPPVTGPTVVVDRSGAVQSNIRLAGPAIGRAHPDFPALALANAVYGGYFTSRLVDNIRERRGYTYSPGSGIEHRQAASVFTVSADVGTDVTAAALVEIRYELGRMIATLVSQDELDSARRYLQGTLAMSIQTQAGLTSYLATLAAGGLGIEYIRDYPAALDRVTVEAVQRVAATFMAPRRLITLVVGDAAVIGPELEAFDEVEVQPSA